MNKGGVSYPVIASSPRIKNPEQKWLKNRQQVMQE